MVSQPTSHPKLSRVALAVLALVAFLAFAEWAVGRWLQSPSTAVMTHRFGLVQAPGARVVHSLEGWSINVCNREGLFDDELRSPRPARRVLLMGDSFAEGLQVGSTRAFPNVAERRLADTEVIDAAQSGGFPAFYAAYAAAFVDAYRPDLLVVQVDDGDVNEMSNPARMQVVRDELNGRPQFPFEDPAAHYGPRERLRRVFKRSALLKFLLVRLQTIQRFEQQRFARKFSRGPLSFDIDDTAGPPPAGTDATFDSLMTIVRKAEPRLMLLYVPHVLYFDGEPRVRYPLRRAFYHDAARRLDIPLVDPSDAMITEFRRGRQPLHGFANSTIGTGHPNALGHEVVGRELAAGIEAYRP